MNRDLLERPFDAGQIKQREGHFGKMLDYIEAHRVIQRLNDAFDARWSFEVVEQKVLEQTDEVLVLGKLLAGEVVKSHFGSSRITRNRETSEMVPLPTK
jgi:recombination DNA repair RAD52 pathway protein